MKPSKRLFYSDFLEGEADRAAGPLRDTLIAAMAHAFLVEAANARLDEHVLDFLVRLPEGGYLGKKSGVVMTKKGARSFGTLAGARRAAERVDGRVVKVMFPRRFRENVRRARAELRGNGPAAG
jgi:hypothetical protein